MTTVNRANEHLVRRQISRALSALESGSSIGANTIANSQLAKGAALTIKGNPTNALANEQDVAASAANQFVAVNSAGTAWLWRTIALGDLASLGGTATNVVFANGSNGKIGTTNLALGGSTAQVLRGDGSLSSTLTGNLSLQNGGNAGTLNLGATGAGTEGGQLNLLDKSDAAAWAIDVNGATDLRLIDGAQVRLLVDHTTGWFTGVKGYGRTTRFSIGTVGATGTVDWATNGDAQFLTLTSGTACTLSFTAPPAQNGPPMKLWITAGAVAALTTLPATCKGTTSMTVTAGKTSLLYVEWDGTNYWVSVAIANG